MVFGCALGCSYAYNFACIFVENLRPFIGCFFKDFIGIYLYFFHFPEGVSFANVCISISEDIGVVV